MKKNIVASRRKIREIMKKYRLVSTYTIKQFKVHSNGCNEDKIDNVVNREFNDRDDLSVITASDFEVLS